ncbi:GNAT family N-acetyltransferase [Fictibacillus fluitans]|uniref:GNAT family N-acetyltransferase n=1 Tax=Fictibacillus fluitans TaxID=3058422 RepID=A0ABT8HTH3_9BACL|nr:GNAT family N-acetyltransferase [Fictibacillus sp. NE201]MDN4524048.1 GNAT family N-acetyltransferase [Fictibacillus sp. NE201]
MDLQDILKLDFAYLSTFSKRKDTDWGALFCNENQPNYYDANHAHLSDRCSDPKRIVDEVVSYYENKNIVPRFYIYKIEEQQDLLRELNDRKFRYEEMISTVQLWNGKPVAKDRDKRITVEVVTAETYQEALTIEAGIPEFGGMETVEKIFEEQFSHPAFTHYLLRYDGIPCSAACLFADGDQARIESVATLKEFRGKGLIGEIIRFIQEETLERGIRQLWIFPINEMVEKVYQKYDFETVAQVKTIHSFLRGKSIKEIHEGK